MLIFKINKTKFNRNRKTARSEMGNPRESGKYSYCPI